MNYLTLISYPFYGKSKIIISSYSLILFIEKVAFDSHSLNEHDHAGHSHGNAQNTTKAVNDLNTPLKPASEELKSDHNHTGHDSDDEEESVIKNVVSSKGKFASFLQQRNILTSGGSMVKPDKALLRASHILSNTNERDEMSQLLVNPQKIDVQTKKEEHKHDHGDHDHDHDHDHGQAEFVPKSNITPYLLLIALSFHGFFEGIALGLQNTYKEITFLFIAIISHKWAEAFTLGISFSKAGTDNVTFIRLILLFAFFTPLGIILGIFLSSGSGLTEAIFLALSTGIYIIDLGTFLYVSASEVIVEEFSVTKYKYQKFLVYLIGGILIGFLAVLEHLGEEEGHTHRR